MAGVSVYVMHDAICSDVIIVAIFLLVSLTVVITVEYVCRARAGPT
jgi:hypothetical protein